MAAHRVDGLAVAAVAGDEVLIADGFGAMEGGQPYTATSACGLYSATKVLASLTYAKLAQDQLIDLNAPLGQYLEDAPDAWQPIPFYRLLNHTSGITMAVNKPEFESIAADPESGNSDIYHLVKTLPLDYEPGEFSRYRQSGYAVGELIVSDQLGVDFDDLVTRYITEPAGMTMTTHPAKDDEHQPAIIMSAGGYETSAQDMARMFLGINNGTVIDPTYWKRFLLDERHLFNDYSLGSVIEEKHDVLSLGHSGGGARANVRYAPDERVGVMVCTDSVQNNWLAIALARMLIQEITSGEAPPMPLLVALADHGEMTGQEVVTAYHEAVQADRYDTSGSEALLNAIGYSFLAEGQPRDAIDVFKLNTQLFSDSPNTYDSLGEALFENGAIADALAQYQKVLTLDPDNSHARAMIEKIKALSN